MLIAARMPQPGCRFRSAIQPAQVWALLLDKNVLWVGGFDGLWAVQPDGARSPLSHAEAVSGLSDQRITVIARGAGSSLWIGTKNGLNRLDLATRAIERIMPAPANPTALAAGYVTSLLTDSRGRLWVATFGGGVNILEGRAPGRQAALSAPGNRPGIEQRQCRQAVGGFETQHLGRHRRRPGGDRRADVGGPLVAARGRPGHFQLLGGCGRGNFAR